MTPETGAAPKHWIHDWDPFVFQFPEGFFLDGIRWYGAAYIAGFATAAFLLKIYFKKGKSPFNADQQATLFTAIIIGTLVGGRLGYMLFYQFGELISNPLDAFKVWEGGMASHGGIIGICVAAFWFARTQKQPFLRVTDILVTIGPPGLFFGRMANFINAELWGKTSDVAWAVIFPIKDFNGNLLGYTLPRHPSQIYQGVLEGVILFAYLQIRFWKASSKTPPGQLSAEFLLIYAVLRIFGEIFREPDASLIFGMSRGIFYSIFMIAISIGIMLYSRKTRENQ